MEDRNVENLRNLTKFVDVDLGYRERPSDTPRWVGTMVLVAGLAIAAGGIVTFSAGLYILYHTGDSSCLVR